jgi:hypothetical protein
MPISMVFAIFARKIKVDHGKEHRLAR